MNMMKHEGKKHFSDLLLDPDSGEKIVSLYDGCIYKTVFYPHE